jgi:hypothetical protein
VIDFESPGTKKYLLSTVAWKHCQKWIESGSTRRLPSCVPSKMCMSRNTNKSDFLLHESAGSNA